MYFTCLENYIFRFEGEKLLLRVLMKMASLRRIFDILISAWQAGELSHALAQLAINQSV